MSDIGYAWIQNAVGAPDFLGRERARLAPVSRIAHLEDGSLLVPHKLAPEPTLLHHALFAIKPGISQEEALVHASDLLRSAAATAYESANNHQGNHRDLAFSVVYLIDMAKAMVERSLQVPAAHANG